MGFRMIISQGSKMCLILRRGHMDCANSLKTRQFSKRSSCSSRPYPLCSNSRAVGGTSSCDINWDVRHQTFRNLPSFVFKYRHNENRNAELLLRSLPNYKNTMFQAEEKLETDCELRQMSGSEVPVNRSSLRLRDSLLLFREAALVSQRDGLSITDPKNQDALEMVVKELKQLSDDDLCQVLFYMRYFVPCSAVNDPAYARFWRSIDEECRSRQSGWSLDFCLVMADLWYALNLARLSQFHWSLIKRMYRRCNKLSKEHFVRFLFCLNLNRDLPENESPYDLEYSLYKIVDQLSAAEVVVISMAFFKTQNKIRDVVLIKKLLTIAGEHSATLDSISVAAVAKFARYCIDFKTCQMAVDFQQMFMSQVHRLSTTALTHLALVGTNGLSPHKEFVQLIVNIVQGNIADTRLKELERIALAMTMFNVECDALCKLIAEELRRSERAAEIRTYGRCLPAILHYLSIRNVFLPDLMSTCLSKEFRDTYYGKAKELFQRELLCLDIAAEIELSGYSGNRLEEKKFKLIMKKNMYRMQGLTKLKTSIYDGFVRDVRNTLQTITTSSNFHLCNVLPQHHVMACVMCKNKEGQFVTIPDEYLKTEDYQIKKLPHDTKLAYVALCMMGRNTCLYNSNELSGQARLQVRQIQTLGYEVKMVFYNDWIPLTTTSEKQSYVDTILR